MKKEFKNPKEDYQTKNDGDTAFSFSAIRWVLSRIFGSPYKLGIDLPSDHILSKEDAIFNLKKYEGIPSITWLGHASFLFQLGSLTILTDPLLFGTPRSSIFRTMKRLPNPLISDVLPDVDILLISHEHYDHIHHPSLKSLKNKSRILPIAPLGISKKIKKHGFKNTIELDWMESHCVNNKVTITAVPAVHYSDFFNTTLWAGFIISFKDDYGAKHKIYFGGDSGYGSFIKKDITPFGPFDVACIGVGAFQLPYKSRAPFVHTNPEQAIDIAKEIDAKKVIGMHWGTKKMADENPKELFPRMKKQAEEIGYKGKVIMLRIGETISLN